MRVDYVHIMAADCTSDPHPVSYSDVPGTKILKTMLDDVVRVCESDMVQYVRSVTGVVGTVVYEGDRYGESDLFDKNKKGPAKGPWAKKHKIEGLHFWGDPCFEDTIEWDGSPAKEGKHIPPGLTGLKEFVKVAFKSPDKFYSLKVGVTWKFAGDSSCSDYIEINDGESVKGFETINFGSQDWWIENDGYLDWCRDMEEFLGRHFPSAR